jgi:hypothetical protein
MRRANFKTLYSPLESIALRFKTHIRLLIQALENIPYEVITLFVCPSVTT